MPPPARIGTNVLHRTGPLDPGEFPVDGRLEALPVGHEGGLVFGGADAQPRSSFLGPLSAPQS